MVNAQLTALLEGETNVLATHQMPCSLKMNFPRTFLYFYLYDEMSLFRPFKVEFRQEPTWKGVCGESAASRQTVIVGDVKTYPKLYSLVIVVLVADYSMVKDDSFEYQDLDSVYVDDYNHIDQQYLEEFTPFCQKNRMDISNVYKKAYVRRFIESIEVKIFSQLVAEVINEPLKQAVEQDKVSHAYLFSGP